MKMDLNITANNPTESADQVVNLSRVGTSDGISYAYAIDTNLVHRLVNRQQVHKVGTETIFWGETNFNSFGLDKVDDFYGGFGDVCHILSMGEFSEERGCSNNNVDTINTFIQVALGLSI